MDLQRFFRCYSPRLCCISFFASFSLRLVFHATIPGFGLPFRFSVIMPCSPPSAGGCIPFPAFWFLLSFPSTYVHGLRSPEGFSVSSSFCFPYCNYSGSLGFVCPAALFFSCTSSSIFASFLPSRILRLEFRIRIPCPFGVHRLPVVQRTLSFYGFFPFTFSSGISLFF